jgi:hypothetical protein
MGERASTIGSVGGLIAVMGLCCGFPILLSAGVIGAIAGIGLGSWIVIAIAAAVLVIGVIRWRRTGPSCDAPAGESPAPGDRPTSGTRRR